MARPRLRAPMIVRQAALVAHAPPAALGLAAGRAPVVETHGVAEDLGGTAPAPAEIVAVAGHQEGLAAGPMPTGVFRELVQTHGEAVGEAPEGKDDVLSTAMIR